MSALKVAVMGAAGRMGQEVIRALEAEDKAVFVTGVDRSSREFLKDLNELSEQDVDMVIDFSLPEGLQAVGRWCLAHKKPLVSGTTGISEKEHTILNELSENTACLWAPNMSVGIAVMSEMLKHFSAIEDFDFAMEEIHHKRKLDKPSGTAKYLQESLNESAKKDLLQQVSSIRGGGVFGIHKVFAMSEDEMITLEHTALNRSVFARGAVRAALWLKNQPPGLYQLKDMIQI